jgi:predicted O-methyltransferase YrrM
MSKLATWCQAAATVSRGMFFCSPAGYRRSQRFVQQINQMRFVEKHANPRLRRLSVKAVIESLRFDAVRLAEYGPHCGLEPLELLVLCTLARDLRPRTILEIGTDQGLTTLNLALNTPPTTRLITVDLPADAGPTRHPRTDPELARPCPRFDLWKAHGVHHRIQAMFQDSALLDPGSLPSDIDLVFVDGSHSFEAVRSDTVLAFEALAPGGMVVWHDFHETRPGVFRFLNRLAEHRVLVHLAGTQLVLYRTARTGLEDRSRGELEVALRRA